MANNACQTASKVQSSSPGLIRLITLDPGHFHAALVQKTMYKEIDSTVYVYAPRGPEAQAHLNLIDKYNKRLNEPTAWKEQVYIGDDYLQKMLKEERPGSVVVIAGNNSKKTTYIQKSVEAGFHVLADKPMAITKKDFDVLQQAFNSAKRNNVLLYDIMSSRYEITNILQREIARLPDIFGDFEKGTTEDPGVTIVRQHSFLKYVSGSPLIRPTWYFDVKQEGNGIVDVTTHLVDLVQWQYFPETILDYKRDINVFAAKQWPTMITASEFRQITNSDTFPDFLEKDVKDSTLYVDANGEMNYTIKGIHAKITMIWNVQSTDGSGDTHHSTIRGTKANLIVRQGKEEQYHPTLYIENVNATPEFSESFLNDKMKTIIDKYPGITFKKSANGWRVVIPAKYSAGHEQNFQEVAKKYISFIKAGSLPDWEVPNMLAKYYTTTQALEMSSKKRSE